MRYLTLTMLAMSACALAGGPLWIRVTEDTEASSPDGRVKVRLAQGTSLEALGMESGVLRAKQHGVIIHVDASKTDIIERLKERKDFESKRSEIPVTEPADAADGTPPNGDGNTGIGRSTFSSPNSLETYLHKKRYGTMRLDQIKFADLKFDVTVERSHGDRSLWLVSFDMPRAWFRKHLLVPVDGDTPEREKAQKEFAGMLRTRMEKMAKDVVSKCGDRRIRGAMIYSPSGWGQLRTHCWQNYPGDKEGDAPASGEVHWRGSETPHSLTGWKAGHEERLVPDRRAH